MQMVVQLPLRINLLPIHHCLLRLSPLPPLLFLREAQYINLCYLNSRSLTNKLTKFQSFVYSSSYDVICITETWSTDYIYDKEILPNKFTLYRRDKESRGGGVLIAVNYLLPSITPPSLEVVSIKLCLSGTQICINE